MTEDKTVGWHHRRNGLEFEQAPGVAEGQGSLACCSPWCHKESDMTEPQQQEQNVSVFSISVNCPSKLLILRRGPWEPLDCSHSVRCIGGLLGLETPSAEEAVL